MKMAPEEYEAYMLEKFEEREESDRKAQRSGASSKKPLPPCNGATPQHDKDKDGAVNGAELLADIKGHIQRFIYLSKKQDYTTVTLWVLFTHTYDCFDIAPRLALHSPVPGCGKSTLFRLMRQVVRRGQTEINPTEAGLFRDMDKNHPTVLFDEMDKYLGRDNHITAVLNAGHARGVTVKRCMGDDYTPTHYDVFGPVAFALKDRSLPADLADRSLLINMRLAPTKPEKFREALHGPELDALRNRASEWAAKNRDQLIRAKPTIPAEITNRAEDNWFPLFAVAGAAGGQWPKLIELAALAYEDSKGRGDFKLVLLANIKMLFDEKDATFYASQSLCEHLNESEEWQWGNYNSGTGLSPHMLAKLLGPFGIKSRQKRFPRTTNPIRGYSQMDFKGVWKEYHI